MGYACHSLKPAAPLRAAVGRPDLDRILLLGTALVFLVLVVGTLALPGLFWDSFLWPLFWGPIEADARGGIGPGGIVEGYNPASTLTYGLVLALVLYGIYRLLVRVGEPGGTSFLLAILPFVAVGAVVRSLEDARFFRPPVSYLMISPLIYVVTGLLTTGLVAGARLLARRGSGAAWRGCMAWIGWAFLGGVTIYVAAFVYLKPWLPYLADPSGPALLAACGFLALRWSSERSRRLHPHAIVFVVGMTFVGGAVLQVSPLVTAGVWPDGMPPGPPSARAAPGELLVVPALAALGCIVVALVVLALRRSVPLCAVAIRPRNMMLFLAHFLDAAATYRGLDVYGYGEKHVVPNLLIQLTGTALVMFPLKALVVGVVVWALDIELRKDLARTPLLGTLARTAILVLGLAPGLRDVLRLALGV